MNTNTFVCNIFNELKNYKKFSILINYEIRF